jgi:hypothetical protein
VPIDARVLLFPRRLGSYSVPLVQVEDHLWWVSRSGVVLVLGSSALFCSWFAVPLSGFLVCSRFDVYSDLAPFGCCQWLSLLFGRGCARALRSFLWACDVRVAAL